jgi:outer membrane lipoprotein LolB
VRHRLPWLAALLWLAGCATIGHQVSEPAPAVVPLPQRLASLQAIRHFDMRGRIAVTNGSDGFTAGLRWQQNDDQASIDLTAPLGFGAAHIQQTDSILRVTTVKGVTLDSDAASEELRRTLGFDAPLKSLRYWVVGATDPGSQAQTAVDSQQRLTHLEQEGWGVDYGDYMLIDHRMWLPQSLTATRETLKVKVVIHDWQLYSILGE